MPTWIATIAPGLEPVVAHELSLHGIHATTAPGHLRFDAGLEHGVALAAVLHTPTRLLLQIGRSKAKTYEELAQRLRSMDWTPYLRPRDDLEVSVSTSKSRLRHRKAVEKKVENAIFDSLRGRPLLPPRGRRPRRQQRVQVQLVKDQMTVTIDVAGELLHRRGWRREAGKAPIRENLGAAMLFAAGWSPGEPLVDPFCGAGTIPIEAALLAAGKGPAPGRDLAADAWPKLAGKTRKVLSLPPAATHIVGADKESQAIEIAQRNAHRAGARIAWVTGRVSDLSAPAPQGLIVTNPPFGARLGKRVAGVYGALGRALSGPFAGWRVAFLAPNPELARHVHPAARLLTSFSNGGMRVGLYVWAPGGGEE